MTRRAREGDLIAIPILRGWALAKVLFVSTYFKNIMLIGVFGTLFPDAEEMPGISEDLEFARVFYTAAIGFEKQGWRKVGSSQPSSSDVEASLRIVGGEVWLGDEVLRSASKHDEETIETMGVDGFIRVQKQIGKMFE